MVSRKGKDVTRLMGRNLGMLKYIVMAPLARPKNFFKYGGGFYAILRALRAGLPPEPTASETLLDVFLAYFMTKYLPPTSLSDILIPIVLGAIVAGWKWRQSQPRLSTRPPL